MAEPTQYSFDLREVTEALIRKQGIKEGQWVATFEFNFAAANLGPNPDDVKPGAFVRIIRIHLSQPTPNEPALPWTVDAGKLG